MGWAKQGQRLRVATTSQHRERLNISGWVAPVLGRYGKVRTEQGNTEGFLQVLRHLYRHLRGYTLWLYVDRARWHKGELVQQFLKKHPRLHLQYLPPYQPGLNPQERIWRCIRYESTTNRWFESRDEIAATVDNTTRSWSREKIRRLCNIA